MGADWYSIGVAVFAAIGTFFFGFDTGIATTTIAHDSWVNYMGHPSGTMMISRAISDSNLVTDHFTLIT